MFQEHASALTQTQSFLITGDRFLRLLFVEILMQDCERHWVLFMISYTSVLQLLLLSTKTPPRGYRLWPGSNTVQIILNDGLK